MKVPAPIEIFSAGALEGYRLLEVSGKGEALKSARRELSARFARKRRVVEAEPA